MSVGRDAGRGEPEFPRGRCAAGNTELGQYDNNPNDLGPNILANDEMGAAMSLADAAWAHTAQTRIFRRFQEI